MMPAAGAHEPTVRRLTAAELARVIDVDVTEEDTVVLVQHGLLVEERAHHWSRRGRDARAWAPYVAEWSGVLAAGGAAWGAFRDEVMIGITVLRRRIRPDTDQLLALFVSRAYRRQGVASALLEALEADARAHGAARVVVSSAESRSAVGTYRARGYTPMEHPLPELVAREPDDVQMVRDLREVW